MSPHICTLCRQIESNPTTLDLERACCLPCKPWIGHTNNVYKPCPATAFLNRLDYADISSIRRQAREIHSQEADMTRSLGFCLWCFVPSKGPEQDKHWRRLIEKISLLHSLGAWSVMKKQVDLDEDTLEMMMDHIQSIGVKHLPTSNRQKELLANIIGGAFGQDVRDTMVARILQWTDSRDFFVDDDSLAQSFRWLQEIVSDLDSNRVWFTEIGIMVIGMSGNVYEIVPSSLRPRYRVTLPECNSGVCLNPISSDDPFGDVLADLVLTLYNDELSSERIPLLGAILPKTPSNMVILGDTHCANCEREMIDGDYTTNPRLAPRSIANPTLCKTCYAGCRLPEGAKLPEDDER